METTSAYRADIDGLRAVAVLLVVFYHFGVGPSGGFVGVDVFFVISGYLITSLLTKEIGSTGGVDLKDFWGRRLRRIVPALLATCIASFLGAALLLPPSALSDFSGSFIAALANVSNVYFWLSSGYFEADSAARPLLHTWSLGVEMQFYVLWPVLLLACFQRGQKAVWALVTVTIGLSLAANIAAFGGLHGAPVLTEPLSARGSTSFYLTPFRMFEFALGAAASFLAAPTSQSARNVAAVLGLGMLALAALALDETSVFPSYNALLPSLGAVLVLTARSAPALRWALENDASTYVGKLSYSIYLVHWPVVVFASYAGWENGPSTIALIVSITAVGSVASYYLVERPLRKPGLLSRGWGRLAAPASVLVMVVLATSALNGWSWRFPVASILESDLNAYGGQECSFPMCSTGEGKEEYVLVAGESFARQLHSGLSANFPNVNFKIFDQRHCTTFSPRWSWWLENEGHAERCLDAHQRFREEAANSLAVILAYNWVRPTYFDVSKFEQSGAIDTISPPDVTAFIAHEIELMKDRLGIDRLAIVANPPGARLGVELEECIATRGDVDECRFIPMEALQSRHDLAEIAINGVATLDPFKGLCNGGYCQNYDERGLYYSDRDHLSKLGSMLAVAGFRDELAHILGLSDRPDK